MTTQRTVVFCFDFISPYSWMALMHAERFAANHRISWDLQPVVYGVVLDRTGLVGPAEVPAKRRYTWLDVSREAAAAGLRLVGPPAHPFRSLAALRVATLFRDDPRAPALVAGLADAAWGEGRELTDPQVLAAVVAGQGLDAADLDARIRAPEVKQALREQTERAIERGVFGVPSFVLDGEVFWGHDRMDRLADRLAGVAAPASDRVDTLLKRPRGTDRKQAPVQPTGDGG